MAFFTSSVKGGTTPIVTFPAVGGSGMFAGLGVQPAPVATAPQPQGPDPQQIARDAAVQQGLQTTLGDLDYKETSLKQQYGIEDASNPFSLMSQLKRNFDIARNSATNSYAARGQQYSGAMQNALDGANYNYQQKDDQLRRDYGDSLHAITVGRQTARDSAALGTLDNADAALGRSLDARPDATSIDAPVLQAVSAPVTAASRRRAARKKAGVADVRNATPAQIRRLKRLGLL